MVASSFSKVFQLGYVEFGTPKIDDSRDYYQNVIGAQETEREGNGATYFSLGLFHHNVAVRPSYAPGMRLFGLQLSPNISIAEFEKQLRALGIASQRRSDARPGIRELLEFTDPGRNVVQVYSSMDMPAPGFSKQGVMANRLGHIALLSQEPDKTIKFYTDVLGFIETDWFENIATFLTCNKDHHVLNIIGAPIHKMHHIAFELSEPSRHYFAADILTQQKIPVRWGPARHTAGHNIASYHYDPNQVLVEFYAELDVFIPELGICDPRPWHEDLPQKPRRWLLSELNAWGAQYEFNLATA